MEGNTPSRDASERSVPASVDQLVQDTDTSGRPIDLTDLRALVSSLHYDLNDSRPVIPDENLAPASPSVESSSNQQTDTYPLFPLGSPWGGEEHHPPEVPPSSPLATSAEFSEPSSNRDAYDEQVLDQQPRQLLLGSFFTQNAPIGLEPTFGLSTRRADEIPRFVSSQEGNTLRNQARLRRSRPPSGYASSDQDSDIDHLPGLMSVSDSSEDEGSQDESSSNDGEERRVPPTRQSVPIGLSYRRDPWVVPGSAMHRMLTGEQPVPTQPSAPASSQTFLAEQEAILVRSVQDILSMVLPRAQQSLLLDEENTDTTTTPWRMERAKKLIGSLESLEGLLLDRFCQIGGGGGEHNDECMICWESLKAEPDVISGKARATLNHEVSTTNTRDPSTGGVEIPVTDTKDVAGAVALPCFHVFHSKCLVPWFTRLFTTCPVCRFDLDPDKLLALPFLSASDNILRTLTLGLQSNRDQVPLVQPSTSDAVPNPTEPLDEPEPTVATAVPALVAHATGGQQTTTAIPEGASGEEIRNLAGGSHMLQERQEEILRTLNTLVTMVPDIQSLISQTLDIVVDVFALIQLIRRLVNRPGHPLTQGEYDAIHGLVVEFSLRGRNFRLVSQTIEGLPTVPSLVDLSLQGLPRGSTSQQTRREWVLPSGSTEGGIAGWVDKKEEELQTAGGATVIEKTFLEPSKTSN